MINIGEYFTIVSAITSFTYCFTNATFCFDKKNQKDSLSSAPFSHQNLDVMLFR
jgi:hypothetical protein